jgi:hypothetical protein
LVESKKYLKGEEEKEGKKNELKIKIIDWETGSKFQKGNFLNE